MPLHPCLPVVPQPLSAVGLWVVCAGLLLTVAAGAPAADVEQRTFVIRVDGKQAGEYRMSVRAGEDGGVTMTGQADVKVSHFPFTYRYSFRGTEAYKNGRLLRCDAQSEEDGKRVALTAVAVEDQLRVTVNGTASAVRPDVWPTSYWRLPAAAQRNGAVPLLDLDTGQVKEARLALVGQEKVTVGGQALDCAHYRLTGGFEADLWYDASERLVRQEWVEDGHPTRLELVRVDR